MNKLNNKIKMKEIWNLIIKTFCKKCKKKEMNINQHWKKQEKK